ncbi:MAG: ribonuclease Z [Sulfolobales archaeon]|nr:ribonuclease Z [Sulfolobales archaeon]
MNLKTVFLGCRAPSPSVNAFTSVAVVYGGEVILLDVGEGTQKYLTLTGLSLAKVAKIFVTHLHGDHVLGLIPLMESRSLLGIQRELKIYGPPGIREYVEENLRMLKFTPSYPYEVIEGENLRVEGSKYLVESFPVTHSVSTFGLKLRIRNKTIVYTSDTKPCDTIIKNAEKADLLIHDSTYSYSDLDKAREYMHSTSVEAALDAALAGARTLILTHVSMRYDNVLKLEREAKAKFFNTFIAEDLMTFFV